MVAAVLAAITPSHIHDSSVIKKKQQQILPTIILFNLYSIRVINGRYGDFLNSIYIYKKCFNFTIVFNTNCT